MIANRVDHVLLGVGNLDKAIRDFSEKLGMQTVVGGVHPGVGTHNALVHFGNAYLELIGVHDHALPRGQALQRFLDDGDGAYGFAVAVDDLDAAGRDIALGAPRAGGRRTPSGQNLRWRAADLPPGDVPLPFLIEWQADDDDGRGWMRDRVERARHDITWGTVHAMPYAASDPAAAAETLAQTFDWERVGAGSADQVALRTPGGSGVNSALGEPPHVVVLRPAARAGEAGRALDAALRAKLVRGPGFAGLAINVPNAADTVAALRARGVTVASHGAWAIVDPADTHGMVLELVGP